MKSAPASLAGYGRTAGVDGVDDLVAVDAPQVDRGDAQVGMPELALDKGQRNALAGRFDGVGLAELVRCEAPLDAGERRRVAQLLSGRALRPGAAVGPSGEHAEQRADRQLDAEVLPLLQLLPGPVVHADLAPAAALPSADEDRAAAGVEVGLGERE